MGNGREGNLRIGTAEREKAVAALADHLTAGRIDVSEYEQRCGVAAGARTRADIYAVFDDLPQPHPVLDDFGPPSQLVLPSRPAPALHVENGGASLTKLVVIGVISLGIIGVIVVTALAGSWWVLGPALLVLFLLVFMS